MKFSQYLRDKSMECILFTGTGIAAGMFLLVLSAELPVILMCELPFFFVFFLCLYLDHSRKKEYYESLLQVFEDLDEKDIYPKRWKGRLFWRERYATPF